MRLEDRTSVGAGRSASRDGQQLAVEPLVDLALHEAMQGEVDGEAGREQAEHVNSAALAEQTAAQGSRQPDHEAGGRSR